MLKLGSQQWQIYRKGERSSKITLRDRFAARQWLQQFKGDPLSINAVRRLLSSHGSLAWRLDKASDDEIIEQAADLLGSGLWHVHEPSGLRHYSDTQAHSADQPAGKDTNSSPTVRSESPPQPLSESRQTPARVQSLVSKPLSSTPVAGPKLSWIRIKLVDADGNPVPGMAYEIKFPDGTTESGKLDAEGTAEHRQIVSGNCEVRFPELDGSEWGPV
jgi:hypothetical protein